MNIEAPFTIPSVPPATFRNGRQTRLAETSVDAITGAWRASEGQEVGDFRDPSGRRVLSIEFNDERGFRIWAPSYGRHVVSLDGRNVESALPRSPAWRWERLLYAQVLPLCATLQGLELFHASAVAVNGGVAAFVATSGTGKSTLATQLIARGATLVTDDVLALELRGDELVGHPGAGLMSVEATQYRRLPPNGRDRLGAIVGKSAHLLVGGRPAPEAMPIRRLYFVRRDSRYAALSVEHVAAPDPRELIASAFLLYVASPSRLENLLAIAAHLAERVRVAEVLIPASGTEPEAVAEAVERDLGTV